MPSRHGQLRRSYKLPLPSSLALLGGILPPRSFAQFLVFDGQIVPSTTAQAQLSLGFVATPNPAGKSVSSSMALVLESTTTLITITTTTASALDPTSTGSSSVKHSESDTDRESKVINLYFLLLFLGVIFILSIYLLLRRRRKEKSARLRSRGHNALALDLATWPGTHVTRGRSGWRGLGTSSGHRSTEEGLDERGEAPPPYEHPPPVSPVREDAPGHDASRSEGGFEGGAGLIVPARILSSDVRAQPPGYLEALQAPTDASTTPAAEGQRML